MPGHDFKPFDCGDQDLNEFLVQDALVSYSELLTVTYIFEDDENILTYFSLLNDKITYEESELSNRKWKRFQLLFPPDKSYKSYPALKIGRLAVNEQHKGQKTGTKLLEYIKGLFLETPNSGCRYITVDAYSASVNFYRKNGFEFLTEEDEGKDTRLMYFDLKPFVETYQIAENENI